jgi:hypothetical protein
MAVTLGTLHSVQTIRAASMDPVQIAEVLFTMSGTYAQADDSRLVGVDALIAASRRNGKTCAIKAAMGCQPARKDSNPALFMGLKTVAVSGADVMFEITEGGAAGQVDLSTELAAGPIPAQATPFSILVSFTES